MKRATPNTRPGLGNEPTTRPADRGVVWSGASSSNEVVDATFRPGSITPVANNPANESTRTPRPPRIVSP
jgi:hypothetical protein